MTNTEDTTNMATLNTAKIQLNQETESYEFIVKGKPVKFTFIPKGIDVRGGVETRDPSYLTKLEGEGELGKFFIPGSVQPTVHINVPAVVCPKGFFADDRCEPLGVKPSEEYAESYTFIQGNNRYKGMLQLMDRNIEALKAAKAAGTPEAMAAYEASEIKFDDFNFEILPLERANDPDFIQWLQVSVNDGVSTHTISQLMQRAIAYINFLKDRHSDWNMQQIRETAASAYGVSLQRIGQFITASNQFPQWLYDKIDQGALSFDTAVKLMSMYNNQVEKATGIKLASFYNECWSDVAEGLDASASDIKITPSSLKKTVARLTKTQPVEDEIPDGSEGVEGASGEGSEGSSGEGSGESGDEATTDPYADMSVDEKRDLLANKLNDLMSHSYNLAGLNLDEKSLLKALKAVESFMNATVLETDTEKGKLITVEMAAAKAEAKAAKAAAEKAAKTVKVEGEQSTNAPSEANPFNAEAVATV